MSRSKYALTGAARCPPHLCGCVCALELGSWPAEERRRCKLGARRELAVLLWSCGGWALSHCRGAAELGREQGPLGLGAVSQLGEPRGQLDGAVGG